MAELGLGPHLIGEAGANSGGNTLIKVCVGEDQRWVFTPQLQRQLLAVRGAPLRDSLRCCRGAGEGHQWDIGVAHEGVSGFGPGAEHNVDDSWGNPCSTQRQGRRSATETRLQYKCYFEQMKNVNIIPYNYVCNT